MTKDKTRFNATRLRYAEGMGWPEGTLPIPSDQEAISAAKRLVRMRGRAFKGKFHITRGNRVTWIRRGTFYVNASRGWRELVHEISHLVHSSLYPNETGHGWNHAEIEKAMVNKVVSSGWLEGKLRRAEKPKPDKAEIREGQTLAAIARWESKKRRAENALKKYRARLKRIQSRKN